MSPNLILPPEKLLGPQERQTHAAGACWSREQINACEQGEGQPALRGSQSLKSRSVGTGKGRKHPVRMSVPSPHSMVPCFTSSDSSPTATPPGPETSGDPYIQGSRPGSLPSREFQSEGLGVLNQRSPQGWGWMEKQVWSPEVDRNTGTCTSHPANKAKAGQQSTRLGTPGDACARTEAGLRFLESCHKMPPHVTQKKKEKRQIPER